MDLLARLRSEKNQQQEKRVESIAEFTCHIRAQR
jgi:hypothetical protein